MGRPAGVNSEDTRAAILAGALQVFGRVGYAAAPLGDVADLADITKAAIYWHFPSKADLFQGVIDLIGKRFREQVLGPTLGEADPKARLRSLVERYVAFVRHNPEVCMFLVQALVDEDHQRRAAAETVFVQSSGVVTLMIEEAEIPVSSSAEGLANSFLAGLLGARVIAGSGDSPRAEAVFDELRARMLEMIPVATIG